MKPSEISSLFSSTFRPVLDSDGYDVPEGAWIATNADEGFDLLLSPGDGFTREGFFVSLVLFPDEPETNADEISFPVPSLFAGKILALEIFHGESPVRIAHLLSGEISEEEGI